ncbi:MAG: 30S ribosome-binding factor RbfA [Thermodesulfobacteriota bacterium]
MWDPKETLESVGLGREEQKRSTRVADVIFRELSVLFLGKVRDPKLAEVAISRVEVTDDLKLARIYYTLAEGVSRSGVQKSLQKAKGFMRSQLASSLNMRYTPALDFYYDENADKVAEMEKLFQEIAEERKGDEHDS